MPEGTSTVVDGASQAADGIPDAASRKRVLLIFAVLLVGLLGAVGAFVWMAVEARKRTGAGDYQGAEQLFDAAPEDGQQAGETFGVRER